MTAVTGPAAMPAAHSHHAPYFSGEGGELLNDFLCEYEELADGHGLTERQKVDWVIRYMAYSQQDLWKSMEGFVVSNWSDLCNELCGTYLEAPLEHRYSKRKLSDFINRMSKVRISEEKDVLDYYRQFCLLSKILVDTRCLDTEGCNKYFWLGFHQEDHEALKERLFAKFPDQPPGTYFDYKEVLRMAQIIFAYHEDEPGVGAPQSSTRRRNALALPKSCDVDTQRSDCDRCASRRDQARKVPYYKRAEQYDSSSGASDDFDSEDEAPCRSAQKFKTKMVRFKDRSTKDEDQELGDLVTQLHGLRTWDSGYAAVYTRLAHHFPNATRDIPKPEYQWNSTPSTSFFQQTAPAYLYQTVTVPPPPPVPPTSYNYPAMPQPQPQPPMQQWAARAPEPVPAVLPATGGVSSFFQPRQHMEGCSFCLQPDHHICLCQIAMDYVHLGRVKVIEDKICLPNGQRIPNNRTGQGLKVSIDWWLTSQNPPAPA
jgi:hypothetical protein